MGLHAFTVRPGETILNGLLVSFQKNRSIGWLTGLPIRLYVTAVATFRPALALYLVLHYSLWFVPLVGVLIVFLSLAMVREV
jgi:hypothetical protein